MDPYILFALLGLASGALYAALGLGLVVTYRGIGAMNFAAGAMGMWSAYVYSELDRHGDLILPVVGLPHRVHLGQLPFWAELLIAGATAAIIGLLAHLLVFRPLRRAPPLARVVASVGIMLLFQAMTSVRFGTEPRVVDRILPDSGFRIANQLVPWSRIVLALIVIAIGAGVWAFFRFTRLGLATVAASENEVSASLAGYSPSFLAGVAWILSSTLVGVVFTLSTPIVGLSTTTFVLMIVPALACALLGKLQNIGAVVVSGLVLGSLQSELTFLSSKTWWPKWMGTGVGDAVPFLVIIVALMAVGRGLPTRGSIDPIKLPDVSIPRNRPQVLLLLFAGGAALLWFTHGDVRYGVISSIIFSIVCLSLVVATGFLGQISFAQAAIAGSAGFTLSKFTDKAGLPFPLALLLSVLVAVVLGTLVAIPALRVRGVQLAVVSLGLAVALERFLFDNPNLTSISGNPISKPYLFGIYVGIRQGRNVARFQFGIVVLVLLAAAAWFVANLARSATGRSFLAVRSNEQAGAACGINVAWTKVVGFGVSSALAGLGGSLIGYSRGQLSGASFTTLVGVSFVAFAYLGGITSIAGALVGGLLAPLGLSYVVSGKIFVHLNTWYQVIAGVGLVINAVFNPVGVAGAVREELHAKRRKREAKRAAQAPERQVSARHDNAADQVRVPSKLSFGRGLATPSDHLAFRAKNITVRYGSVRAVDDASIDVRAGHIVGLIGPNGAGKTSFLDAVSGFTPSTGSVDLGGESLDGLAPHRRTHAGLGRTWQSMELFADLSVRDNVRVAAERVTVRSLLADGVVPLRNDGKDQTEDLLALVGLAGLGDTSPRDLPLGQQKLLGVARALARHPSIALLDEPAAGLDSSESVALGVQLRQIANAGLGILLIDHDMGLVLEVCDYVYVLDFGRVIAEGAPAKVRRDPRVIEAYLGESTEDEPEPSSDPVPAGSLQ